MTLFDFSLPGFSKPPFIKSAVVKMLIKSHGCRIVLFLEQYCCFDSCESRQLLQDSLWESVSVNSIL